MERSIERLRTAVPALLRWYGEHRRSLPFRDNPTPYRVWISEIMLQQTRIEAALPRYEAFLQALPTVEALADVPDEQLLKLWEGLGYYSRARHLKQAAQQMVERYGGTLPADVAALRSLAGIGEYTAGAIASLAFGLPVPAVDGNVLRVLARLLCYEEDVLTTVSRRHLTQVAAALLPPDRAGAFNEAIMELGETVCLPNGEPRCERCPLSTVCEARAKGMAERLPLRISKTKRRTEQRTVFVVQTDEKPPCVLLHKRTSTGLLAGLWELPNKEGRQDGSEWAASLGLSVVRREPLPSARHLFSHREWDMTGVKLTVRPWAPPEGYVWVGKEELIAQYALPSAFRAYTEPLLGEHGRDL